MEKCVNHPERLALSFCFSCKRHFCSDCLVEGRGHYFCRSEECQKMWEQEVLPAEIECPHCATVLELDENERKHKQLRCPVCKRDIDLKEGKIQLGKAFIDSALEAGESKLATEGEPLISTNEDGERVFMSRFDGDGVSLFGIYFITGLIAGGIYFGFFLLMMLFSGIGGKSAAFAPFMVIWLIGFIVAMAYVYAFLRSRIYDFYYSNVKFGNDYLTFTGTLQEIYKGILKALLFAVLFAIVLFGFVFIIQELSALPEAYSTLTLQVVIFLTLFIVLQYAYFSSRRYRFSRIVYKRKPFLLAGNLTVFAKKCIRNGLLSLITLGVYLPIYFHQRFAMLYNNLYFGNEKFCYGGKDKEFFKIALEGFFLTVMTLGVYYFWWKPQLYNYYIRHLRIGEARFDSDIKPGPLFKLLATNLLLIVFTLGIGMAWAEVRLAKFYLSETRVIGPLDPLLIEQLPETVETEATGDAMADYFGLGGVGIF